MNCNTTHYRANSSSVPGDPTDVADTLAALAIGGEQDIRSSALAHLNDSVAWLQGDRKPLWFTLLGDDQVKAIVALDLLAPPKEYFDFLASVIATGGPRGNALDIAAMAVDAFERYLTAPAFAGIRQDLRSRLREAAGRSPYPVVAARAERVLSRGL